MDLIFPLILLAFFVGAVFLIRGLEKL